MLHAWIRGSGSGMMTNGSERPCVVHLVRAANGPDPFAAFLAAWQRVSPGVDCELVLALKGFPSAADARPYLDRAGELVSETVSFDDLGRDLDVYFAAAAQLGRERYCFLNSYSEPLTDGWLGKLDAALRGSDVGLVGATGSWASNRSWLLYNAHLPSAYASVFPDRREARGVFRQLDYEARAQADGQASGAAPAPSAWQLLRDRWRALPHLHEQLVAFDGFPSPHVRTNAFLIEQTTLRRLALSPAATRHEAYRVESGRHSLTRQVRELGLRALVVDRQGVAYEHDRWDASRTLWQGDQEGLLVADNQTRGYARGDLVRRATLSRLAWGSRADPRPPSERAGDRP